MSAYRLRTHVAVLLAVLSMVAVLSSRAADDAPAAPNTLALVNGEPLSSDLLDVFSRAAFGRPTAELPEAQQAGLLDALIRADIIAQAADKLGLSAKNELDNPGATRAQVEFGRLQSMNQAAFAAFERDHAPSEEDLRAEYARQIALVPRTQYHAHHILLNTQGAAEAIIKQLRAGANFETLAKQDSIDPSGSSGGDLGWFSPKGVPDALAAALKTLKKGELAPHPIQSTFGWHVVRLDETRAIAPPTFESMRDKLDEGARTAMLENYVGGLLKAAQVQKF
jgi:peptidyl-prolyl cis-trans isomerase C